MAVNKEMYNEIIAELGNNRTLVAVSKTKPAEDIQELYDAGQRDFGENYVQEMADKQQQLPSDINWHFIGHLQSNKVKYIAAFVHLIHGVDTLSLLAEINKQAAKFHRIIPVLLQLHIAQEETKFGMDEIELAASIQNARELKHVRIAGLMGMASFSEDNAVIRGEFQYLKSLFDKYAHLPDLQPHFQTLSMGMSGDYKIAMEEGSTMVRIGSLLFGPRNYAF